MMQYPLTHTLTLVDLHNVIIRSCCCKQRHTHTRWLAGRWSAGLGTSLFEFHKRVHILTDRYAEHPHTHTRARRLDGGVLHCTLQATSSSLLHRQQVYPPNCLRRLIADVSMKYTIRKTCAQCQRRPGSGECDKIVRRVCVRMQWRMPPNGIASL